MRKPFGSQAQVVAAYVVDEIRRGLYEIDNSNAIWRVAKRRRDGSVVPVERHRIDSVSNIGYAQVNVSIGGRAGLTLVHHVVLALNGVVVPAGKCVNHIDGNKQNNDIGNLEVVDMRYNALHARRTGLCRVAPPRRFSPTELAEIAEAAKTRGQLVLLAKRMGRHYNTVQGAALRLRRVCSNVQVAA
jgi:hypothetical protein